MLTFYVFYPGKDTVPFVYFLKSYRTTRFTRGPERTLFVWRSFCLMAIEEAALDREGRKRELRPRRIIKREVTRGKRERNEPEHIAWVSSLSPRGLCLWVLRFKGRYDAGFRAQHEMSPELRCRICYDMLTQQARLDYNHYNLSCRQMSKQICRISFAKVLLSSDRRSRILKDA